MISRRLLRIKILQILYAHFNTPDTGLAKSEKDLLFSINKSYDLYVYLLLLAISVKQYAKTRIDLARNKKLPSFEDLHPNTRFVDNHVIRQIETNPAFNAYLNKHKLSWANYPELIKNLYTRLVHSDYYRTYMESDRHDYVSDRQVLIDFYSNELEESEMFLQTMEEQSIFWNDDIDFVLSLVTRVIRSMPKGNEFLMPSLYKSEDDREFAFLLLHATVVHHSDYNRIIELHAKNWDLERIALIDNLIIHMAINELIEFPSIPVKVTFDEYLELSKYYSTPKSSVFINGLLDSISSYLKNEGKVQKTGRGLITESTEH